MVRLKDSYDSRYSYRFHVFQFHMVRLKARISTKDIPHIIFQFHMVRLKAGANRGLRNNNPFQFHMVRLKVFYLSKISTYYLISIPYGTIKSA